MDKKYSSYIKLMAVEYVLWCKRNTTCYGVLLQKNINFTAAERDLTSSCAPQPHPAPNDVILTFI